MNGRPTYTRGRTARVRFRASLSSRQNKPDPRGYCRWPAYAADTRSRPERPVVILVLAAPERIGATVGLELSDTWPRRVVHAERIED